jgi:RimJ/RimL family protein N-acetyltransferase
VIPKSQAQPSIDLQPVLEGDQLLVRPLRADDLDALHTAASDPLIWEQHPSPLRYQREVFEREFFQGALASGSAFAVIDKVTGKIMGSAETGDCDWFHLSGTQPLGRRQQSGVEAIDARTRLSQRWPRLVPHWQNQLALTKSGREDWSPVIP